MTPELIVMLTNNDKTVIDAVEVFESCKDLPVQKWGFKDVGLDKEAMIDLNQQARLPIWKWLLIRKKDVWKVRNWQDSVDLII